MSERRVVITGIGCISPLGNDLETTWDGLKNGRSGIRRIENIDATPFDCKIAGEIRDFNADGYFGVPKDARRSDRYVQYAVAASKMAMTDSGLDTAKIDARRYGVMVGSGIGGLSTVEREHSNYIEKGPRRVSPFTIPMMISNIASGIISMEHGLLGPNMVIVTACATSNHNIGEAWRIIKFGDADGFLCGGAEAAVLPMGLCGFANMKALSTRNDEPEKASRPFDKHRDGFVMGEGAGVVMIEELETAKARGAKIYCELLGFGMSGDAYHMTAPNMDGPRRCMVNAMRDAHLNPDQIQYLNAHGTSTPLGDKNETEAIKAALGDHAKKTLINSTKSMTGHLLGGAGGLESVFTILALHNQKSPPTINIFNQDPECDLDYCANTARDMKIEHAVKNNCGFGGTNGTLIFGKLT